MAVTAERFIEYASKKLADISKQAHDLARKRDALERMRLEVTVLGRVTPEAETAWRNGTVW